MDFHLSIPVLTIAATLLVVPMRAWLIEGFEQFQLAGLPLLCLKNETKEETERDLQRLIDMAANDPREKKRREGLLAHINATDDADPIELAKYTLALKAS